MSLTAEKLAELSATKRALLEKRLRGEKAGAPPQLAILRDPGRSVAPLSFSQERAWFFEQLEPGGSTYNLPMAMRVTADLDPALLAALFGEIVRRHEALRTAFVVRDDEPLQMVLPAEPWRLPVVDLSGVPAERRDEAARELAQDEALRPFDLTRGPMLRTCLLRLGELEQVILLTLHHIAADGWSTGVLVQEVGELYGAFLRRERSPLPELPVQYADFAVWQRNWLRGEVLDRLMGYWRGQLAGADTVLDLPVDRARGAFQSFRGQARELTLPAGLGARLRAWARVEGVTPFMLFLAAFKALLCRYTGREDVSAGTPVAGRNRREIEGLIGFFVNTLVLRTDLGGDPPFRTLLGRVRQTALDAFAHQDLPFEKLVEELRPERSLSHTPLFQVMFVLQNTPAGEGGGLEDLDLEPLESGVVAAEYDWTLEITEEGESFNASLQFRADLFDGTSAERALAHLHALLEAAAAEPDRLLWDLPLAGEAERHQILEWSSGPRGGSPDGLFPEAFAERARLTPDAPAVLCGGTALSYRDLDEASSRLARELRELGVGPESIVGLCLDRSPELAVGLLGILKSGGAWLPLDPAYPTERLAFLLADSEARALVTVERLAERIPPGPAVRLRLDSDGERIARHPAAAPVPPPPQSPAYAIYTSGSTGRPKGTLIPHAALAAYLRAVAADLGLSGGDRVLQFASPSFDVSVEEILPTWLSGAALVLRPQADLASPAGLLRALTEDGVTVCNLPTAFWHEWVLEIETAAAPLPPSLRLVVIGGEAVLPERLEAWERTAVPLLHGYGLTETTVTSTFFRGDGLRPGQPLPIGRPLANTELLVADRNLRPVPVGVPGELCIAGESLARGYFRRPEVTAERFVPQPWGGVAGERACRTGDRVRFLADGNLEFLGRLDAQVKVRGFRVEPGEIEAALGRHPEVRDRAVVARRGADGTLGLVAYVAPDTLAADELRRLLREELPDYMVPGAIVPLAGIPRTPAGKVDRAALPEPAAGDAAGGPGPRTQTEDLLAALWAQVLGVERVRAHDDFFDLGGHSLLATRLMSRVRESFGVEVPLRALFEAPTLAGLAAEIETALRSGAGRRPPIEPAPRDADLPLSFAQRRLWFIDQLEPESAAYNMPAALRLEGDLDVEAFARTLTEIVRRHEALRTRFPVQQGEPVQRIDPPAPVPVHHVDLGGLDEAQRLAQAQALAAEDAQRPFDLENGPLLRAGLLRLAPGDHVLLFSLHHIVSDAWSMDVLVREIAALYQAFSRGEASSPLPELAIQYADYAAWQRGWLQGEVLAAELAGWKERLTGTSFVLNLPTDRPRPPVQSFRGRSWLFDLPPGLTEKLRQVSRREGVTLFMTLLTAFEALLSRASGQDDFCVGTPVAGRNQIETEDLIGFFVNTLVLRADLRAAATFRDLLRQAREVCLSAFSHQDFPLERLVEELQPERDLSRQPLFQVMFTLEHEMGGEEADLPGFTLTPLESGGTSAKFDLLLSLAETEEGLSAGLDYVVDLFDAPAVGRMAGHLEALLHAMAEDPGAPLAVDLLSAGERQQALCEWNDTQAPVAEPLLAHRLVEAQARSTPELPAVVDGAGAALNYRELNERANRLARRLRALGAGPEVKVGVWLERSPDLIAACLGVLKAGGAYLPLDVHQPQDRLAFLLEDSGVPLVVSQGSLAEKFPAAAFERGVRLVLLDQGTIDGESGEDLPGGALPGNLAYVIYTSGSTGRPKGTELTHAGLANLIRWHLREHGVTAADRATQVASPAFDASVWEVWPYLAAGASLHLPSEEVRVAPAALLAWLAEREITLCFLPTPLAEALLDQPPRPLSLRSLLVGGDRLRRPPRERLPFRLVNHYGPTESTVVSTFAAVEPSGDGTAVAPPIGRPLDNLRAFLLDRRLLPVPAGVTGELCVGGAGLARGYLGRSELTAERFLPDPFAGAAAPGSRLYRTGDLARFLPDGRIDFLGRADHQVKIRGHRIEPGEIETALLQHKAVKEAAVVAREDRPGDLRLVAYVIPTAESKFPWLRQMGPDGKLPPFRPIVSRRKLRERWNNTGGAVVDDWPQATPAELRAFLADRLPDSMIPAAFVTHLEELPLTANGKLDRAALPAPKEGGDGGQVAFVAPRTATEELIAGVFSEVLGARRVGVNDNFFELGGHSLLATLATSRLRKLFGLSNNDLPLRNVFETPTVAELAAAIGEAKKKASGLPEPPIERVPRTGPLPLSFSQQRLWFLDRLQPGSAAYNIPQGMRMGGAVSVPALQASLGELVRRHEILRTTFAEEAGEPVQVIAPPRPVPLPVLDLSALEEERREAVAQDLAQEELERPFDLSTGPLLRVHLLRFAEKDHMVLVTVHHVVSDGWSMGILVREVGQVYDAFLQGKASPLAELPVQYADFAVWQRSWLQGEVLESHLAFWRKQLEGAPPLLDLPADRPRPQVQTTGGALQMLELPAPLTAAVKALGPREGATLFMTLLAGFQALLSAYTGRTDVVVGTPSAGRNQIEVEGLIGFFVNTLVLRTDLAERPTARDLVRRVREVVLQAYAHQDLPFERLVEELQPLRNLSHGPLFQVMLVLQNNLRQGGQQLPGVKVKTGGIRRVTAQRDLTLEVQERGDNLLLSLEYNVDLFDHSRMTRLLRHFELLLGGLAASPETPVDGLPLLSEPERHQLLEWSGEQGAAAAGRTLADLLASAAAAHPEREAVIGRRERLRFGELRRRAEIYARGLLALGLQPEDRVAVLLEREPEMVAVLWGVLAAGGAYVPLDAGYPEQRRTFTVEDSGARLVVPSTVTLAALAAAGERWNGGLPRVSEENLAYVLYTSGSTGRPKGVAVEHRNAVALVRWAAGTLDSRDLEGVLASTSIGFDLSVFEIWATLALGGRVILAENALELASHPAAGEVRLLNTVPSALAELARTRALGPGVRTVGVAGEPLRRALASEVYENGGVERLLNLYGPTECTTYATASLVERESGRAPSIGRPIEGTRAWVVDGGGRPAPIGVPGELLLGGLGVSRGYLGRPELTAERFVPDGLGSDHGGRLYRTGDYVRWSADGDLEFLGRLDHQVKVRGFRIELGEIEEALTAHPEVEESVVMVREAQDGDRRLVGWYAGAAAPEALREALRLRLPEHMVPPVLLPMGALPRTATGKVDRRALPDPEGGSTSGKLYVAPRNVLERDLAVLWEEVLGVKPVGIRDDFFTLGGHSLLAVRLLSRIEGLTGKRIPMAALFQGATVERLAALVREQGGARGASLVPIQAGGTRLPMFWVHPAGGNVLCYAPLARALGDDFPFYGLQAQGLDSEEAPFTRVEDMAAHYLGEIRAVRPHGPYFLAGWSMGGVIAFEMARQLQAAGEEVAFLTLVDVRAPELADRLAAKNPRNLLRGFALDFGLPLEFVAASEFLEYDVQRQLRLLLERAQGAGLLAPEIGLPQLSRIFDVFQANVRAMSTYEPGRYAGGLALFKAAVPLQRVPLRPEAPWLERTVRRLHLTLDTWWSKLSSRFLHPTLGWKKLVDGTVEKRYLPGTHYTLLLAPQVETLAEWLRATVPADPGGDQRERSATIGSTAAARRAGT